MGETGCISCIRDVFIMIHPYGYILENLNKRYPSLAGISSLSMLPNVISGWCSEDQQKKSIHIHVCTPMGLLHLGLVPLPSMWQHFRDSS